jgi:glycosyltransferase involved in cell wall biosynthesis
LPETTLTILIPCKDAKPSYFREAINSVFLQTSSFWQLLVIDDHSKSRETIAFLNELRDSEDKRLRVIKSDKQRISGALNAGMKLVETPFVCMLHCDDLLDRKCIETLSNYINEFPDVDYFHSARQFIDDDGNTISSVYPSIELKTKADFIHSSPIKHLHCWKVVSALEIGGIDETLGLHGADDFDFPWCMAEAGFQFKAVTECLYYYRDHREHERLTTHVPLNRQIEELVKIFRKHNLSEGLIKKEITRRRAAYLRTALFEDEQDRRLKGRNGFDPRLGIREKYRI